VYSKRNTNSPTKKKIARVCVLKMCKTKCKKAYFLKKVKAHHDPQNSGQQKKRPENVSPEEIIINRGITYHLRNVRFSRKLTQNKVTSEIS
jgi:hypothetical protein